MILRITPFLLCLFTLYSHADTIAIHSGFSSQALQAQAEQMSCRHIQIRAGQTESNLETFVHIQNQLSEASQLGELSSFIRQRNGYPADLLLRESVYRIHYPVQETQIAETLLKSQSTALWGVGFFEHQNPNGGFEQIHYRTLHDSNESLALEFDVRAVDVCLSHRFELIFFTDCPTETIRFDTCDYDQGVCSNQDHWESPPFVTQWWKCKKSTTLSFDLSELAPDLGRRQP